MEYSARRPAAIRSVDSGVISTSGMDGTRFSILCGFAMTYLYWAYMIFVSHAVLFGGHQPVFRPSILSKRDYFC